MRPKGIFSHDAAYIISMITLAACQLGIIKAKSFEELCYDETPV